MHHRGLRLLLLALLTRCETPQRDCSLTMIAEMPIQVQDRLLVVPAGINGKWTHLVLDSGAERSTISDTAADRLGLQYDLQYTKRTLGIGGVATTKDVTVDGLVLGGVRFPINRIAVSAFNLQNQHGLSADGLLGADVLLAFDLDIDVPGNRLTLYRSRSCPTTTPPWREKWIQIAGVQARKDRLLLPFELDNVAGLAILDTGAQGNILGVEMARRMGLSEQAMADDPAIRQTGTGPRVAISRLHRFKRLQVGPVVEEAPFITVLQSDFGVGDALIGEDFLQGRRIWLSFRGRQVFISRRPSELLRSSKDASGKDWP